MRRVHEAGYTLVEVLVALVVLALAVGGLTAGMQAMAHRQQRVTRAVVDAQGLRRAQVALDRVLQDRGPFGAHQPERFTGDADSFAFECGAPDPCEAELSQGPEGVRLRLADGSGAKTYLLRRQGPAHFLYDGAQAGGAAWPPGGFQRQSLRGITVVGAADAVLLKARLWLEQPMACDFDAILQDCR